MHTDLVFASACRSPGLSSGHCVVSFCVSVYVCLYLAYALRIFLHHSIHQDGAGPNRWTRDQCLRSCHLHGQHHACRVSCRLPRRLLCGVLFPFMPVPVSVPHATKVQCFTNGSAVNRKQRFNDDGTMEVPGKWKALSNRYSHTIQRH